MDIDRVRLHNNQNVSILCSVTILAVPIRVILVVSPSANTITIDQDKTQHKCKRTLQIQLMNTSSTIKKIINCKYKYSNTRVELRACLALQRLKQMDSLVQPKIPNQWSSLLILYKFWY